MNDSLILTLCLQENTLLISNAVIEQLGSPSLIQIRMNEADKSLLITPCEYGIRSAVVVPDNHMYQLEMPDRSLIRRIQRITEWQDDNPRVLYGVFIPQHNAIYFSLDTAQYAILQPAPGTDDSTLPSREGSEAYTPSQMDAITEVKPENDIDADDAVPKEGEADSISGLSDETNTIAGVTVDGGDGEDGDLNG